MTLVLCLRNLEEVGWIVSPFYVIDTSCALSIRKHQVKKSETVSRDMAKGF